MRLETRSSVGSHLILLSVIALMTTSRSEAAKPKKRLWGPAYLLEACPAYAIDLGESVDLLAKAHRRKPEDSNDSNREAAFLKEAARVIDAACDSAQSLDLLRPNPGTPDSCYHWDGRAVEERFEEAYAEYLKGLSQNHANLDVVLEKTAPQQPRASARIHEGARLLQAFLDNVSSLVVRGREIDHAAVDKCRSDPRKNAPYRDPRHGELYEDVVDEMKEAFKAQEPMRAAARGRVDEFLALCRAADQEFAAAAFAILPPEEQARRIQEEADKRAAAEASKRQAESEARIAREDARWIGKRFSEFHKAFKGSIFQLQEIGTGDKIILYSTGSALGGSVSMKRVGVNRDGVIVTLN